jgi:NifU-like protein involved in Fe-S cluster formation
MSNDLEQRIHDAITNPRNLGEMKDADSVGTVGNPDCNDMLRMWVKFKEDDQGRKIIDRATFQTFGCETALAVASVATELIAGKTIEEALSMSGPELSAPLGPLPPMKIHCAQLVEGALRAALTPQPQYTPTPIPPAGDLAPSPPTASAPSTATGSLIESFSAPAGDAKVKVVLKKPAA